MHFLIDENLPFQLGKTLAIPYTHASTVEDQASDSVLWKAARQQDWIIITRDTDFFNRLVLHGAPPKVIWIRMGNLRKSDLIEQIRTKWELIAELIEENDLIQVYPDSLECMKF